MLEVALRGFASRGGLPEIRNTTASPTFSQGVLIRQPLAKGLKVPSEVSFPSFYCSLPLPSAIVLVGSVLVVHEMSSCPRSPAFPHQASSICLF